MPTQPTSPKQPQAFDLNTICGFSSGLPTSSTRTAREPSTNVPDFAGSSTTLRASRAAARPPARPRPRPRTAAGSARRSLAVGSSPKARPPRLRRPHARTSAAKSAGGFAIPRESPESCVRTARAGAILSRGARDRRARFPPCQPSVASGGRRQAEACPTFGSRNKPDRRPGPGRPPRTSEQPPCPAHPRSKPDRREGRQHLLRDGTNPILGVRPLPVSPNPPGRWLLASRCVLRDGSNPIRRAARRVLRDGSNPIWRTARVDPRDGSNPIRGAVRGAPESTGPRVLPRAVPGRTIDRQRARPGKSAARSTLRPRSTSSNGQATTRPGDSKVTRRSRRRGPERTTPWIAIDWPFGVR